MSKCFSLFLFVTIVLVQMASGQNTVGLISYDPDLSSDGYNLFFPHNQSTVFLTNNCGEIVHSWEDEDGFVPGNIAYLHSNGHLYKAKRAANIMGDNIWAGGGGAILEIRDWDNTLLWEFEMNDSLQRLHHDFAVMPNGHILALAWELKNTEECLAAGRDTSTLTQGELWPDWVFEIDPFNDTIVWEWHAWDHLVQDFDSTRSNYGVISEHPELIDVNYGRPDGHPDWHHGNALDYNAELDQIILSIPYFDEVWIIDHSTSTQEAASHSGGLYNRGGDLLYRWGNPVTYGRGEAGDRKLFFQHDAHWIDDFVSPDHPHFGKLAIFNNRFGNDYSVANVIDPGFSMYDGEYPLEEGVFLPLDYDQTIAHPDSTPLYSTGLSSVQFLDNGNVLLCSGRWGYSFELTPDNHIVWEYITPLRGGQPVAQGEQLAINNNLTFRLKRYPPDYEAFNGRDLSPKGYIELSPDTTFCQSLVSVTENQLPARYNIYPNPVTDYLTVRSSEEGPAMLRLINSSGSILKSLALPLSGTARVNVKDLPGGIYLLQLINDGGVYARPVIISH